MRKAVHWQTSFALAILAAIMLKLFLFDFMIADGDSMAPTIKSGTVLVINRLQYGFRFPGQKSYIARWGRPKPGDIVVFYTPERKLAVKRCMGLHSEFEHTQWQEGGKLFFIAQGDNSLLSYDSRSYGLIPVDNMSCYNITIGQYGAFFYGL